MKKTLVSALTTALVVGAASTTFAAANPFEDVPADHWAYDAIAQLAADGVIEGYGDGTYRGDQEITRYEMAQMVARAMAKGGGDKALIDKLAAEFADELNNLGVRVAALEKKVDNVKWGGKIRYRYIHRTQEGRNIASNVPKNDDRKKVNLDDHVNVNGLLLRFEPQMKINEHWTGKARIDYNSNTQMNDAANVNSVSVDRIYVQGDYKNLKILLGKLPYKTQADYGMIMDRYFSGGSVTFGSDVKVALNIGRVNDNDDKLISFGQLGTAATPGLSLLAETNGDLAHTAGAASYGGIEIYGDRSKKFTWGIGWHYLKQRQTMEALFGNSSYNIMSIGLGYKFTPDLELTGAYSHANGIDDTDAMKAMLPGGVSWNGSQKNSYAFQLSYKGAKPTKVNSWGAFVAWRQLGAFSSTGWNTYRLNGPQDSGTRGFEIGVSWTPMKNLVGKVQWFTGKNMEIFDGDNLDSKVNAIFTEWNFLF